MALRLFSSTTNQLQDLYIYTASTNQWQTLPIPIERRKRHNLDNTCIELVYYDEPSKSLMVLMENGRGLYRITMNVSKSGISCTNIQKEADIGDEFTKSFWMNNGDIHVLTQKPSDYWRRQPKAETLFHQLYERKQHQTEWSLKKTDALEVNMHQISNTLSIPDSLKSLISFGLNCGVRMKKTVIEYSNEIHQWKTDIIPIEAGYKMSDLHLNDQAVVCTSDGRYIITFACWRYAEDHDTLMQQTHDISVYDRKLKQHHVVSEEYPLFPEARSYSAMLLADGRRSLLVTTGFVRSKYKEPAFKNMPIMPGALVRLVARWSNDEYIHLMAGLDGSDAHWRVNVVDILAEVDASK